MVDIVAGLIALIIALVFLAIPVVKLNDVPLWIVALIGVASMVWSFLEITRNHNQRRG